MFQVGKVQYAPARLLPGVVLLKAGRQLHQAPHRGPGQGQIGQQLPAVPAQVLKELVHLLLAAGAQSLHPLRRLQVLHALFPPRRRELHWQGPVHAVPAVRRQQGPHPLDGLGETGAVILAEHAVPAGEFQRPEQQLQAALPLPPGVGQQQRPPGGVPRVGDPLQGESRPLLVQPGRRVRVALDAAEHVQHDLLQAAVVPPGGHGVHQGGKVPLRVQILVLAVQGLPQHPGHQDRALPLVAQPKVRVQPDLVAALPQQSGTEGVHRGDLGLVDQRGLPPQVPVVGPLRQPVGQLLSNPGPQLCRSRPGICNDQEVVDIRSLPGHLVQQPLHQHPGLARAGRSRHQQSAPPVMDCSALFLCQGKGHLRVLLSLSAPFTGSTPASLP